MEGGWHHEGTEVLHIASSLQLAQEWINKHFKEDDRYPNQPNESKVMRALTCEYNMYYDFINTEDWDVDS